MDNNKVKQIENKLNQHMRIFNKIFKVGSAHNHESRVTGATNSNNTPAPPMYGLKKDHKEAIDPVNGPAVRNVVAANQLPNNPLSHFLSRIVNDYADAADIRTECRSSEEMRAAFDEYNKNDSETRLKCCVLSMDVEKLYPSMDWE